MQLASAKTAAPWPGSRTESGDLFDEVVVQLENFQRIQRQQILNALNASEGESQTGHLAEHDFIVCEARLRRCPARRVVSQRQARFSPSASGVSLLRAEASCSSSLRSNSMESNIIVSSITFGGGANTRGF